MASPTASVGGRRCETRRDPFPPGTGTRLYVWSVQRPLLPPREPPQSPGKPAICFSKTHTRRKNNPKNKIKFKHLGQRGLPRCPGELAAGLPFPFAFQHSGFVRLPPCCQGNGGGEARGVSVYLHSSRTAGLLSKDIGVSCLFVNAVKAENCFLSPCRAPERAPAWRSADPAKLWALSRACFHQQRPTAAGCEANDKQMISKR